MKDTAYNNDILQEVRKALAAVIDTPQGEFYIYSRGNRPTTAGKSYYLRMMTNTANDLEAHRAVVRDICLKLWNDGKPTPPDISHLMSLFGRVRRGCECAGHEWPDTSTDEERRSIIASWGSLADYFYGWINMMKEYFQDSDPTVPAGQDGHQEGPATDKVEVKEKSKHKPVTLTIDRDKMADFFKVPFKSTDPNSKVNGFDNYFRALASGAYTATDIGRIAYQVHKSDKIVKDRRKEPFAVFARKFFDACGCPVPEDLAPNKYAKPGKTDYSDWLK